MDAKKVALKLVEDSLEELESQKGSVLSAIQKLHRAADMVGDDDKKIWCAIQLGDARYTRPLKKLNDFLRTLEEPLTEDCRNKARDLVKKLDDLGLNQKTHYSDAELGLKSKEGGGGYLNIGFIESKHDALVKARKGNDGQFYVNNLNSHINYIRTKAHDHASQLFTELKFSGTTRNCFDLLKNAVDDRLLDLNPMIAEQLMLAFKSVSSNKAEEWSHSLTTCRRLLEGLADELYPPSKEKFKGRLVGQAQYVNRLWAFMEDSIQSDSNKELAKSHVDFLGSWLEKTNTLANKGVHAEVGQIEAVKSVFHTYLVVADILDYLQAADSDLSKPNIATASLDELEAMLNVQRGVAKEIVKARVQGGGLDLETLSGVKGIGPKTVERAKEVFEFE